jgi:copper chaperone
MFRNTVKITGMACGMCEAHIADTIRRIVPGAEKLKVSHTRSTAVFLSKEPVDEAALKAAVDATGYHYEGLVREPYEKKSFFHRG